MNEVASPTVELAAAEQPDVGTCAVRFESTVVSVTDDRRCGVCPRWCVPAVGFEPTLSEV
jgi:hypothetical protein